MKKIGIMTMHRVVNYGSFLQAYSLKNEIEKLGYTVSFVDYKYENSLIENKKASIIEKILNLNFLEYIKYKNHSIKFSKEYVNYLKELDVTEMNFDSNIDTLVIGSDEVFNCIQPYPVGYSRNLFGYEFEDINVISYAASFGYTTSELLKKYNIYDEVKEMILKFKAISVRDDNSFSIIKKMTTNNPEVHFDPVLIGDFDTKMKMHNIKKDINNFIIIYAYPGRLTSDEKKYIKSFAKKHKKKIVSLGFYQSIADYNLIVNPFEALNYIKNADYVITDTFHGTVFSIKTNTKFCTIIRKSNYNKLSSLLNKMNHLKQMVMELDDIEKIFNQNISFKDSERIIYEERKKTLNYLKENL